MIGNTIIVYTSRSKCLKTGVRNGSMAGSSIISVIIYGALSLPTISLASICPPLFIARIQIKLVGRHHRGYWEKFLSAHPDFWRSQLGKILNKEGNTIGYEVRPLYHPWTFGRADILDVYYRVRRPYKLRARAIDAISPPSVEVIIHSTITRW